MRRTVKAQISRAIDRVSVNYYGLCTSLYLSAMAYEAAIERDWPDLRPPFDMNEHAKHLGPGIALGFIGRTAMIASGVSSRVSYRVSSAGVLALGGLFETGIFDKVYRNTTHDVYDALWTAAGGLVGALCARPRIAESSRTNAPTHQPTD